MLRMILSVITGYFAIAVLVIVTDAVTGSILKGGRNAFTILNLATALPFGAVGGYIAARIARGKETTAAIALCAFSALMSVVTVMLDRGSQPIWYLGLLLALLVAGVLCGGFLRSRQTAQS